MASLVAYGAYVPFWRLDRADIGAFLGRGAAKGERAVASWDEDTTTMGVEAARLAMRSLEAKGTARVFFATTEPAYLAKTNATAVHAALDLDASAAAFDLGGGAGAGVGAAIAAAGLGGIAVASDMRVGPAGSVDEAHGGDAAAALVFGDDRPVADLVGVGHTTREYLERWQIPGEASARNADARFVEHVHAKLVDNAIASALKDADVTASEVDHVLVAAPSGRTRPAVARAFGRRPEELADDLVERIGYAGAAHWMVLLAEVLDRAEPGQHVAVVAVGEGVSSLVFRTASLLPAYRDERAAAGVPTLADRLSAVGALPYGRFLAWRRSLSVDEPARPNPQTFSPVAAERNARWKFALVADDNEQLSAHPATVVAVTVDHTADTPASLAVIAVVEFPGGRRVTFEVTDIEAAGDLRVGDPVELTFRRLGTREGVHDYFWKARPYLGPAGRR
jgi:3-hydroxy-3-methylglutaryl CoA synthase